MSDWDDEDDDDGGDDNTAVITENKPKVEKPPLFKVLLHNDDYTTQEFVVRILQSVFHKGTAEAVLIMAAVHHNGIGIAGVYSHEIAESKVSQVTQLARADGFPLLCTIEQE